MNRRQIFCVLIMLVYTIFGAYAAVAETPCAHTSRNVELVSAATCTAGSVEREVCTLCGAQLDTWTNSDKLAHSWKAEIVSSATCTKGSVEREICSGCGEVNDLWTNDDKLGHGWKTEIVSSASCTKGSIEREVCSRCGEENGRWTNSDAKGHTPGAAVTCTSPQICTVCKTELVPAKGHTPGTAATCTSPQLCTVCKTELVPAKGHTPGTAATCTSPQLCTICKTELVPAKGHTPGTVATCTSPQLCTVCKAELAPAKGHAPGAAANCTNPQLCTACKAELAPAKGHTPGAAANCTNPQLCTACKAELAPAKGHTPGAAAICGKAQLCEVCGIVLTDALQHSYKSTVYAPTETKQGFTRYTCTLCGNVYDDNYKRALGKLEQAGDGLQLIGADGRVVPYETAEVNEPISTGDIQKKILKITAKIENQSTAIGHYDLVLTKYIIEGVLSDGYDGICINIGDAEITLPLENFNKNDILADILKDQDAGNENVKYIIRLSQEEAGDIENTVAPVYRVDVLLNVNGNELDVGDIIGGMVIRLHGEGIDSSRTDAGLFYQPKLTSDSTPAILDQITRTNDWWEVPFLGSGTYTIVNK